MQRLAHIDVAKPRYDSLVKQQRFDRCGTTMKGRNQMGCSQAFAQRFRTQGSKRTPSIKPMRINQIDRAKTACIIERQDMA